MDYKLMNQQLEALIEDETYYLPNMANGAALLWHSLKDINWAGFYLMDGKELVLGPFQGKVACIRIQTGHGVCGTAVAEDKTQLVSDVHEFPGHIACDGDSRSEIVIPIHKDGQVFAVLDIDSPLTGRFDQSDREGLEDFVRILEKRI